MYLCLALKYRVVLTIHTPSQSLKAKLYAHRNQLREKLTYKEVMEKVKWRVITGLQITAPILKKGMLWFPNFAAGLPSIHDIAHILQECLKLSGNLTEAGSSLITNTDGKGRSQKWLL